MGCRKIGIARVRLICGESIPVDGLWGNISDYRTAVLGKSKAADITPMTVKPAPFRLNCFRADFVGPV